ncbi:SPOR domain-containing protein [Amylibacter sp. SFDW26]|uniref:SPOR domain-containing protein n=1 Tax=Amylibacter sp. SFDW26 TaxID=2652722 RepID=UPI00126244D3|nr:SPOR domain-containing protein [Amylibacter sp. SFDW26]KAB7615562.1 SPOR domain-containing protein [Amylibacter sp. SFDW26]
MSKLRFTNKFVKIGLAVVVSFSLTACEEGTGPSLFKGSGEGTGLLKRKKEPGTGLFSKKPETSSRAIKDGSIKLVERDVESPEIFQVTEKALWDGRPSLGGVWVAHPDSDQPERVIIRNKTNGKFVIGALFRRERNNPGPKLQLSSDAASALGVLAGAPTTLNVTVLRRETVNVTKDGQPATPESVVTAKLEPAPTQDIKASVLDSVAKAEATKEGTKAAAKSTTKSKDTLTVDLKKKSTEPKPVARKPVAKPSVAAAAATPTPSSSLSQPFIQLGFFSEEGNAKNTLKALETRKIPGRIVKATAKGKTFWRVIAGPAQTKGEREAYMKEIKKMGFADAYLTKN